MPAFEGAWLLSESKLKKVMIKQKITQENLAKKLGNRQSNVSYLYINGIKRIKTARRYAKVLSVDILDILEYEA